jgi:hypothetical protein
MTKWTNPPLLNENLFHHLDQFTVIQNLLDNMRMGLPIEFAVRETALPTHLATPFKVLYNLFFLLARE